MNKTILENKTIPAAMKLTAVPILAAALKLTLAAAAAVMLLASCGTFGSRSKATRDEEAIAGGTAAWNQKGPAAARPYWTR